MHPIFWPQETWAEKWWAAVPLNIWGELGPHLTQCRLADAYLHTKWHLDPSSRLATNKHGPKIGGRRAAAVLFMWRRWIPFNAMSPGPKPISVPPYPTVWTQYSNVTESHDISPVSYGEPLLVKPRLHDKTCCHTGWQPVKYLYTRYNRLSNRFDNRLYRVNKHPTDC